MRYASVSLLDEESLAMASRVDARPSSLVSAAAIRSYVSVASYVCKREREREER